MWILRHYLRHCCLVKPKATPHAEGTETNAAIPTELNAPRKNHRRHKYQKVYDGRKQPIRGLWMRNGRFIARIKAEKLNFGPVVLAAPAAAVAGH